MHPELKELLELLQSAQSLLTSVGEATWSNWLIKDIRLLKASDLYGVEHLLSAFGGMGSLNDLVLHPINGHQISEIDISSTNQRFDFLRNEIHMRAKKLWADELK